MNGIGRMIARYLAQPVPGYEPATPPNFEALRRVLRPADILLIEGNKRISSIIKYLTQSTWSHAAIYVGNMLDKREPNGEPHVLIEAEIDHGIVTAPLSKYRSAHVRVCRPVALTPEDQETVLRYVVSRVGCEYDLKNLTDLGRYLVPLPIPARLRRRAMALGSGSPTRAICSTLIAEAFQLVGYPILPRVDHAADDRRVKSQFSRDEILLIRHHSLYTPRDFDLSPYFAVVKPTLEWGFDYKTVLWERPAPAPAGKTAAPAR
jgi:Permuted papain-like amidase enzyme, YaeF/YiiX, C92 family